MRGHIPRESRASLEVEISELNVNELGRWVEFHGATKCFFRLGIIRFLAINLVKSTVVKRGGRLPRQVKGTMEDE